MDDDEVVGSAWCGRMDAALDFCAPPVTTRPISCSTESRSRRFESSAKFIWVRLDWWRQGQYMTASVRSRQKARYLCIGSIVSDGYSTLLCHAKDGKSLNLIK